MSWRTTRSPTPPVQLRDLAHRPVEFDVPVDALRAVMARWFFMFQITCRYTNSPETRIQEDISRIAGFTSTEPGWPARRAPVIDFLPPTYLPTQTMETLTHLLGGPGQPLKNGGLSPIYSRVKRRLLR
jgi:hypothetical protein